MTREPHPWLSLLLAVPHLIVVVAMGYTRQEAALGLLMLGLASLLRTESLPRFIFWVAVAALFQKARLSACRRLPFSAIAARSSTWPCSPRCP